MKARSAYLGLVLAIPFSWMAALPSLAQEPAVTGAVGPVQARRANRLSNATLDTHLKERLRPLVERHAGRLGLPYALADAVIRIESRYRVDARNGPYYGLTQINAATARSLGYSGPPAGLLDPDTNLSLGLRYLATAYRLAGGETCGAILRYRGGHRAERMTAATRAYCDRVLAMMALENAR